MCSKLSYFLLMYPESVSSVRVVTSVYRSVSAGAVAWRQRRSVLPAWRGMGAEGGGGSGGAVSPVIHRHPPDRQSISVSDTASAAAAAVLPANISLIYCVQPPRDTTPRARNRRVYYIHTHAQTYARTYIRTDVRTHA